MLNKFFMGWEELSGTMLVDDNLVFYSYGTWGHILAEMLTLKHDLLNACDKGLRKINIICETNNSNIATSLNAESLRLHFPGC